MMPSADTIDAFDLGSGRLVSLIGGGGKTALSTAMAGDLVRRGRRVLVTTTTRILHPHQGTVIVEPDIDRLVSLLAGRQHATVARAKFYDDKLKGYSCEEIERLAEAGVADVVLVEADGAAGRPLKAHADHEPVIPAVTDLVIVVIGIDCIGVPLSDEWVHRAERFADLLGLSLGQLVTPETVAAIILHPQGYLRRVPLRARVAVLLNKVDDELAEGAALACAEALRRGDHKHRVERIVIGSLLGPTPSLRSVWSG